MFSWELESGVWEQRGRGQEVPTHVGASRRGCRLVPRPLGTLDPPFLPSGSSLTPFQKSLFFLSYVGWGPYLLFAMKSPIQYAWSRHSSAQAPSKAPSALSVKSKFSGDRGATPAQPCPPQHTPASTVRSDPAPPPGLTPSSSDICGDGSPPGSGKLGCSALAPSTPLVPVRASSSLCRAVGAGLLGVCAHCSTGQLTTQVRGQAWHVVGGQQTLAE